MSRTVQIRDLDDETYAVLRRRAAEQRVSLSHFLRHELDRLARTRTMAELLEEADAFRARQGGVGRESIIAALDEGRAEREAQLDGLVDGL
jgi:cellobiose-specific phosphotransferase system component IIA